MPLNASGCSQVELADWLGLSSRRIRELTAAGILRKSPRYDLRDSVRRYLEFLRSKPGDLTDERARLVKFQADLAELRVRARTGELVERASVTAEAFTTGRRIRDGMENLPARLSGVFASECDQSRIFELFSREIHSCLEGLANDKPGDL